MNKWINGNSGICNFVFVPFTAMSRLIRDYPVVTGVGNWDTRRNPLPQVTGNFLTCPRLNSTLDSGERQLAVSGNTLDHTAIRALSTLKWWR